MIICLVFWITDAICILFVRSSIALIFPGSVWFLLSTLSRMMEGYLGDFLSSIFHVSCVDWKNLSPAWVNDWVVVVIQHYVHSGSPKDSCYHLTVWGPKFIFIDWAFWVYCKCHFILVEFSVCHYSKYGENLELYAPGTGIHYVSWLGFKLLIDLKLFRYW